VGPDLRCPRLSRADLDDLDGLRGALASAPAVVLGQAWRAVPDPAFRPGSVRAGWRPDELLVLAELEDDDIFTQADGPRQRFWELGDVFEIFLEPAEAAAYAELHVAPGNRRAALRIPVPRPSVEPEALMVEPAFDSRSREEAGRWLVAAAVPFSAIGGRPARFSFSRYDYTRGRAEPVHSSTSPHRELDFHRRREWGTVRLA
jgi:hypothetical protein